MTGSRRDFMKTVGAAVSVAGFSTVKPEPDETKAEAVARATGDAPEYVVGLFGNEKRVTTEELLWAQILDQPTVSVDELNPASVPVPAHVEFGEIELAVTTTPTWDTSRCERVVDGWYLARKGGEVLAVGSFDRPFDLSGVSHFAVEGIGVEVR